jgi:hypothetical protein
MKIWKELGSTSDVRAFDLNVIAKYYSLLDTGYLRAVVCKCSRYLRIDTLGGICIHGQELDGRRFCLEKMGYPQQVIPIRVSEADQT